MDRLFEFVVNHYILVSLFVAFLVAILILESRRGGAKISAQGAVNLINKDEAVVVDIRDRKEFGEGRITGSINIPLNSLKSRGGELSKFNLSRLGSVQCEACHGPLKGHPEDANVMVSPVTETTCTRCHDEANSPDFDLESYWRKAACTPDPHGVHR